MHCNAPPARTPPSNLEPLSQDAFQDNSDCIVEVESSTSFELSPTRHSPSFSLPERATRDWVLFLL